MQPTLLFIHGMFLNPKSWENWVRYFEQRGYRCLAPAWPWHDGDPAARRAQFGGEVGQLSLASLVEHYAEIAARQPEKPVLIGHALGGLIVQLLISRDLGAAGVCICPVAPNGMLSFDWDFVRTHAAIANPLMRDRPCALTEDLFHHAFCNTMTREEAREAYANYVLPDSRRVLRDSLGRSAQIDLSRPHAPLLFLCGDHDRMVPDTLTERNAEAYTDRDSVCDFQEFAGHGHFICNEPGWREVAGFVEGWLAAHAPGAEAIGFALR